MLTFAYLGGGGGQDPCLRNHICKILTHILNFFSRGTQIHTYIIAVFQKKRKKNCKKNCKKKKKNCQLFVFEMYNFLICYLIDKKVVLRHW